MQNNREIYKILVETPVGEQELKEMEQLGGEDILAKARLKQNLKQTLFGARKKRRRRAVFAASAATLLLFTSTAYVGVAYPAYAAEIPIVGDIFRFLDQGRTGAYDLYQENANEIQIKKEDQGIAITIESAVFDGQTVFYTYSVKTEQDLGERPLIGAGPVFAVKNYYGGMSGGESLQKVSEGYYIGQASYRIDETRDHVVCKLEIDEIRGTDEEKIKGTWNFQFALQAVEQQIQQIGQSVSKEAHVVTIDSLERTPMSFSINYSQLLPEQYLETGAANGITAEIEVRDNLGNIYPGSSQGGQGNMNTGEFHWRTTFGKLDDNATQIIITPSIYFSASSGGGVSIAPDGTETALETYTIEIEPYTMYLEEIAIDLAHEE